MARRIVYKQGDEIRIVSPAQDDDDFFNFVLEKDVKPNAAEWWILDETEFPYDRYFRNAWHVTPSGGVDVHPEKAKTQRMAEIRKQRNEALDATDKDMARLTEQGKNAEANALKAKRQTLRDLPNNISLDGLTPDQLKNFDPVGDLLK
jgi:hypothetical protein